MGFPFWKQRPFLFIRHTSINSTVIPPLRNIVIWPYKRSILNSPTRCANACFTVKRQCWINHITYGRSGICLAQYATGSALSLFEFFVPCFGAGHNVSHFGEYLFFIQTLQNTTKWSLNTTWDNEFLVVLCSVRIVWSSLYII
jgi:hypothetical protein